MDEPKPDMQQTNEPQKKRSRALPIIAAVLAVVFFVIAGAGGAYLWKLHMDTEREKAFNQTDEPLQVEQEDEGDELVDNPVDFAALKGKNNDIYAWLSIPGTDIEAPILQSATDDNYYLTHDRYGQESLIGAIFSQSMNSTDFTDPVTLLYGHDVETSSDAVVFRNLHLYEDATFFAENEKMTIVTPGHILTYQIIAAYEYDDRHIMNSFDFSNQEVLQEYFNSVLNPTALVANVREGVTLDASKDKIVQMSTCMLDQYHGPNRYIVTGVLIDDQPTR